MTTDMKLVDLPGVGPATAEKLKEAGFGTVISVAVAHPMNLVEAAGVSETVARKIIAAARESLKIGFVDGITAEEEMNQKGFLISTNSKAIDNILAGGVKSGIITEVFGQYGSSKTQIAHQLAVNAIHKSPEGIVVYIDTENTFTPLRIRQMSKAHNLDGDEVLSRIRVARAHNSDHQTFLAENVEQIIQKGEKVLLLVVDSLTAHFRAEFIGRGTLADRQQKINKHMSTLSKIAELYDVVVFVTNQITDNPGQLFGNPQKAIGGNIVGHNSKFRIYLRPGAKGTRVAKLVDSPFLPEAEATYIITEDGVTDV